MEPRATFTYRKCN